ncbi:MAG: nuclease [Bacteroidia bacterium]|nr:nuclease [Bacteroidia bacterium]
MKPLLSILSIVLILSNCKPSDPDVVTVKKVVDGDTFITTQNETIRLIGIDAPEKQRYAEEAELFAAESTYFLDSLISGQRVKLMFDVETYDVYDRTLAYVFTEDSVFVNEHMLKNGMAYNFPFAPNLKYAFQFKQTERKARKSKVGIWNPELK